MSPTDLTSFRRLCGRFRWLAVFMTLSVGTLVVLTSLLLPVMAWLMHGEGDGQAVLASVIWIIPTLFYLYAVSAIGQGMGDLSRGRLFAPTVSQALRRVGIALGLGGVFSVFIATNLLRMLEQSRGGYLHFDVAGMTLGMIGGALYLLGRVVDQAGVVQAELDEMI